MDKKNVDLSTIFSMLLAVAMLFYAIVIDGSVRPFLNLSAFLIVIVGTILVTISCFSFYDFISSFEIIYTAIFFKPRSPSSAVIELLKFSEEARKYNLVKDLENVIKLKDLDPFFVRGINMLIDNNLPTNIEKIMQQEINANIMHHNKVILVMRKAAETAPAMGLIGTLIGLVQMLGNLTNPSQLGPSMAIALLTTFYGAVISYMIFFPLASKIERDAKEEYLLQIFYLKTLLSVANKENPRHLEVTLNSLLDSSNKIAYYKV